MLNFRLIFNEFDGFFFPQMFQALEVGVGKGGKGGGYFGETSPMWTLHGLFGFLFIPREIRRKIMYTPSV